MNILFLLSSLEPAGSETYCVSLAKELKNRHRFFWISPKLHFGQDYLSLPIERKAFPHGVANAFRVAAFIRKHRIDLVHSHARRAHWTAAQAAWLTGIKHVTTIHQPPPVHFFSRAFPCLGDVTLAVSENTRDHLERYFKNGLRDLRLVRNGIDLSRFQPLARPHLPEKRILLLGRISGGRWRVVQFFLDVLERIGNQLPPAHYSIAGHVAPEHEENLNARINAINKKNASSHIERQGFVADLRELLAVSDGVIAGGRSALESAASERPVIVMGERALLGLFEEQTRDQALATNFGDHQQDRAFDAALLERSLRRLLVSETDSGWGRAQVQKYYNGEDVANSVDQVYQKLVQTA